MTACCTLEMLRWNRNGPLAYRERARMFSAVLGRIEPGESSSHKRQVEVHHLLELRFLATDCVEPEQDLCVLQLL